MNQAGGLCECICEMMLRSCHVTYVEALADNLHCGWSKRQNRKYIHIIPAGKASIPDCDS